MDKLPTYENDKDLAEIIYTDYSEEKLMAFFIKKKKVNVSNLLYLINEYAKEKNKFSQGLIDLKASGKIKYLSAHLAKPTIKAKWQRFRDSKTVWWIIAIATLLVALLAWLLPRV